MFWLVQSIITGKGDRAQLSPQDRVLVLCASPVSYKGCVKKVQMEKLRPRDCVSGSLAVSEIA